MGKWIVYEGEFGNDAMRYKEVVGGVTIAARVYDCDGDFVEWAVSEDGKFVAGSSVSADGKTIRSEEQAWELAKKRAELVICYGIAGIRKLMEKETA